MVPVVLHAAFQSLLLKVVHQRKKGTQSCRCSSSREGFRIVRHERAPDQKSAPNVLAPQLPHHFLASQPDRENPINSVAQHGQMIVLRSSSPPSNCESSSSPAVTSSNANHSENSRDTRTQEQFQCDVQRSPPSRSRCGRVDWSCQRPAYWHPLVVAVGLESHETRVQATWFGQRDA